MLNTQQILHAQHIHIFTVTYTVLSIVLKSLQIYVQIILKLVAYFYSITPTEASAYAKARKLSIQILSTADRKYRMLCLIHPVT